MCIRDSSFSSIYCTLPMLIKMLMVVFRSINLFVNDCGNGPLREISSVSTSILINRTQGDSFSLILMRTSSYCTCQLFAHFLSANLKLKCVISLTLKDILLVLSQLNVQRQLWVNQFPWRVKTLSLWCFQNIALLVFTCIILAGVSIILTLGHEPQL